MVKITRPAYLSRDMAWIVVRGPACSGSKVLDRTGRLNTFHEAKIEVDSNQKFKLTT